MCDNRFNWFSIFFSPLRYVSFRCPYSSFFSLALWHNHIPTLDVGALRVEITWYLKLGTLPSLIVSSLLLTLHFNFQQHIANEVPFHTCRTKMSQQQPTRSDEQNPPLSKANFQFHWDWSTVTTQHTPSLMSFTQIYCHSILSCSCLSFCHRMKMEVHAVVHFITSYFMFVSLGYKRIYFFFLILSL